MAGMQFLPRPTGEMDTDQNLLGLINQCLYLLTTGQVTLPISGSFSIDTSGLATEATLTGISNKLPASVGQKAMAASFPIVIASDQSIIPTNNAQVAGTTIATGDGAVSAGVQRVTNAYPSKTFSTALENDRIVKNSAGTLHRIGVYNNNGATRYLQLFDAIAAPSDGDVPVEVYTVLTATTVVIQMPEGGSRFSTGIYACLSTTAPTKTLAGDDGLFWADYD